MEVRLAGKPFTPREKTPAEYARRYFSQFGYGRKVKKDGRKAKAGDVRRINTNAAVAKRILGEKNWCEWIGPEQLEDHFAWRDTLYFANNEIPTAEGPYYAIHHDMGDVDCHQEGNTQEGADRFVAEILAPALGGMPKTDGSTSGLGQHAQFYVGCRSESEVRRLSKALKVLEKHLTEQASEYAISGFEIKGTVASVYGSGSTLTYKGGQLAKIPRDLQGLLEQGSILVEASKVLEVAKQIKSLDKAESATPRPKRRHAGSFQRLLVPEEQIQAIFDVYIPLATKMPDVTVPGKKVTATDKGAILGIVAICQADPNENGTLPMGRIKAIWRFLYEEGHLPRAYDCQRAAAVMKMLEEIGVLEWEVGESGYVEYQYRPGKRCGTARRGGLAEGFAEQATKQARTLEEVEFQKIREPLPKQGKNLDIEDKQPWKSPQARMHTIKSRIETEEFWKHLQSNQDAMRAYELSNPYQEEIDDYESNNLRLRGVFRQASGKEVERNSRRIPALDAQRKGSQAAAEANAQQSPRRQGPARRIAASGSGYSTSRGGAGPPRALQLDREEVGRVEAEVGVK